ncbi:CRIB domain-containing protein RIC10-like [Abrus precatorius]|uniref:CRIB domain-containing protein RIC10-like n=1 Tax=Abrus precatorius TaxID=3816 RepID=A0A8B8L325_ABRPR|nr:CRIB domain-containing protein RIC10-like [Abrus precatorius]
MSSNNTNNNKVKGLLKGLRFISQIFDNNEKEEEIEIGHPTNVKHLAHIGRDGPVESAPSWMNEFKSVPEFSSASPNGDIHSTGLENSAQQVSKDSIRRGSKSRNREGEEKDISPELPKSSKRQSNSSGNMRECRAKEKSDRPRHQKKSSKHSRPNDSCKGSKYTEQPMMHADMDSLQLQMSDDMPKRSRSKMSKDGSVGGGSTKSRSKRDNNSNPLSPSKFSSKSKSKHMSFEEDEQLKRGHTQDILKNYPN